MENSENIAMIGDRKIALYIDRIEECEVVRDVTGRILSDEQKKFYKAPLRIRTLPELGFDAYKSYFKIQMIQKRNDSEEYDEYCEALYEFNDSIAEFLHLKGKVLDHLIRLYLKDVIIERGIFGIIYEYYEYHEYGYYNIYLEERLKEIFI
jgi:hypothetical protein